MKKVLLMLFALVLFVPFIGAQEKASAATTTWANGSTSIGISQGTHGSEATVGKETGKWYWEVTPNNNYPNGCACVVGIVSEQKNTLDDSIIYINQVGYYGWNGNVLTGSMYHPAGQNYGAAFNNDGVIGVALDVDNKKIKFYKNGVSQGEFDYSSSNLNGSRIYPSVFWASSAGGSPAVTFDANFGASTFAYTVPSGYLPYNQELSNNPSNPANLTAVAGNASVTLTWSAVNGAMGYNVKRSTTAGGPYTTIGTAVTGTTYNDSGLTNGTKYYYVVTAVNADGESNNSNEANATPTASVSSGRALLTIHLVGGGEKEYDLSAVELDSFLDWTDSATQSSRYKFVKTWNNGPFKARAEYIVYGKIVNFDVDEYDPAE
ncbi:SPRY domain-containing protein [Cohnella sp. GCM10020058]|uniref:SPRY domain-containing protein n=1 Tax=Cohnella sp. GCM10020058 TaxID=3317330 RepID=UPI00362B6963